uniref:CCHC-type domain-containing protein n=1 Tax=Tanacetum cinerariifolium TaxID=118510 RepID=A0A6L2MDQ6_TANCI|nr:hypothetical protein [Tanacetum cinerariifolium]
MTDAAIKELIAQGVADALAEYEANISSINGDDSHNSRNGKRRQVPTARKYTYSDFFKCRPLNFKGTEGVVEESDQVKKYVGGLPDMIQGSVMASKPNTMQKAIEIANDLLDQKCTNSNRAGHLTRDCRSPAATNNHRTLTCYECENQGHYMSDCPELKNRNHRNQVGGTEARRMVYALGGGETNQDPNNIKDDINA